jgi:hypothetical protein
MEDKPDGRRTRPEPLHLARSGPCLSHPAESLGNWLTLGDDEAHEGDILIV